MNVIDAISNFRLDLLPLEWVENVWSEGFTGEKQLPEEYDQLQLDEKDYLELMVNLIKAIRSWNDSVESVNRASTSSAPDIIRKSWPSLSQLNVHHKSLIGFISTFIKSSINELIDRTSILLALTSSRLYFSLLSIPGAIAYNVFNPILYDQALNVFKILSTVFTIKRTGKKPKSPKGRKKKKNVVEEDEAEDDDPTVNLGESDKNEILNEVNKSLRELSDCLKELYLRDEYDSLCQTVQIVVGLTRLETESNILVNVPRNNTIGYISYKSYCIIEGLCIHEHGDVDRTVLLIMRFFVPSLVISEQDVKMSVDHSTPLRNHTFVFIHKLVSILKDKAAPGAMAIVQQLCVRMPDKSDIRAKAIPDIIRLLQIVPYDIFYKLLLWITSLAHADLQKYRVCSVELIAKFLNVAERSDDEVLNECFGPRSNKSNSSLINDPNSSLINDSLVVEKETNEGSLHQFLLAAVISRFHDISPIIRYKCLNIFSTLILSNQKEIQEIIHHIFLNTIDPGDETEVEDKDFFDFKQFFKQKLGEKIKLPKDPLPSSTRIMSTIETFVNDDKVFVRKSSLHVIANLCLLDKRLINPKRIKMLVEGCRDSSVMIRKLMSKCVTDLLLTYPDDKQLIVAWVDGVHSLITDNEMKCQEKIVEYVTNVIIDNISYYADSKNIHNELPWEVLNLIAQDGRRSLFRFACQSWSLNGTLKSNTLKILESHIGTENNFGAWFLIVCISEFQDFPNPKFIVNYFFDNIFSAESIDESLSQLVLEAVFLNVNHLNGDLKKEISGKLKTAIENFNMPAISIARSLDICYLIDKEETKEWCGRVVDLCETYLKKYIAPGCTRKIREQSFCQHVYTLGDAVHYHPGTTNETLMYLANLLDPNFPCEGMSAKWEGSVNNKIKAMVVITLGKICLQDYFIAKKYVPVLAILLNDKFNANAAVKINTVIALSDICIRSASVVEDYLGDICVMLKDSDLDVRKNTLNLLMHLVQEDYLKLKSRLFFYFLLMMRDSASRIRKLTEAFIVNVAMKKKPNIMCHYFIEAIFFFNDFQAHEKCTKEFLTPMEKTAFSVSGGTHFNSRGKIYRFMLDNMQDDHRFRLSNKICTDILDEFSEGRMEFDEKGTAVLKDALFSLACKEMRLENLRKDDEDEHGVDKGVEQLGEHEVVLDIAKKAFLSQIVKRNYIDSIVPVIIKLKRILVDRRSVLVRDLMICLRELMKDFKTEINDILSADPELAAEVALDLKDIKPDETIREPFAEFNIMEVRIQCERLSEKALADQMGMNQELNSLSGTKTPTTKENFSQLNNSLSNKKSVQKRSPLRRKTPPQSTSPPFQSDLKELQSPLHQHSSNQRSPRHEKSSDSWTSVFRDRTQSTENLSEPTSLSSNISHRSSSMSQESDISSISMEGTLRKSYNASEANLNQTKEESFSAIEKSARKHKSRGDSTTQTVPKVLAESQSHLPQNSSSLRRSSRHDRLSGSWRSVSGDRMTSPENLSEANFLPSTSQSSSQQSSISTNLSAGTVKEESLEHFSSLHRPLKNSKPLKKKRLSHDSSSSDLARDLSNIRTLKSRQKRRI